MNKIDPKMFKIRQINIKYPKSASYIIHHASYDVMKYSVMKYDFMTYDVMTYDVIDVLSLQEVALHRQRSLRLLKSDFRTSKFTIFV